MAATKEEINRAIGTIQADYSIEIMERIDNVRRRFGLDDEEMADYLRGWDIDFREQWDEYLDEADRS